MARCCELNVTSQGEDVESARTNLHETIDLYHETWCRPEDHLSEQQPFWAIVEIARENAKPASVWNNY